MSGKFLVTVCLLIVLSCLALAVEAAPSLSISAYKNNGYGLGEDIQGLWTINTAVSSNVLFVEFYLDGQLEKNATNSPFNWQFHTSNYTEGKHTIRVVAYDSLSETATVEKQANFVGFPVNFVVGIIVFIVIITVSALAISIHRIRKYNAKKKYDLGL